MDPQWGQKPSNSVRYFPPGLKKAFHSISSPIMNLHTRPPSMCADLCNVKWGGADRGGWIPVLLLPSACAFPREAGAPDTFCKQISLSCRPGGQPPAVCSPEKPLCLRAHLPTLFPEPGDKSKMQQQQITSSSTEVANVSKPFWYWTLT